MWCIPGELDQEYIERMEDILDLYSRPYDSEEPVVCLDEKPIQLLKEVAKPVPARPGRLARRDYEYIRCGTANTFCIVEPQAGRYLTVVTKNRKGPEYAKMLKRIARKYPDAITIHLVQDNLNTHTLKSLIRYYGEEEGTKLWNRFTVHYTPKHASWLNQAEIAISMYSKQCIGKRRIGDIEYLKKETVAWNKLVNRNKTIIAWKFTTTKAREKFNYDWKAIA